jgi:DNA-binding NarL/FixJ family response regulator
MEEIRKAERTYRDAAIRSLQIARDSRILSRDHVNGNSAIQRAYHAENAALQAYRSALQKLVEFFGKDPSVPDGRAEELTNRERDVLQQIAWGRSTKEIAYTLGVTFKTAATHREHLLRKLNARNTADLTRAAIRLGLVNP